MVSENPGQKPPKESPWKGGKGGEIASAVWYKPLKSSNYDTENVPELQVSYGIWGVCKWVFTHLHFFKKLI